MKVLFLVYHGFSEVSGITKKIRAQVKGLRQNGHEVCLCYYDFSPAGHRCRYVDGEVLRDYGQGALAALRQRTGYGCIYDYCLQHGIELVYARCFQNASPFLVRLFRRLRKAGVKSVTEIPTYPYDQEFKGFTRLSVRLGLQVDRLFRSRLARQMEAMVTFSDATEIFGQRTIRISNGVDLDALPLHQPPADLSTVHLIAVAEVHYWHGLDRLIDGLGRYVQCGGWASRPVVLHIVGGVAETEMQDSMHAPGFAPLMQRYGLTAEHVVMHGQLFGAALDGVFAQCCFAVGSLGRHRSGISVIKTLKNREYASRGLPFIYSEQDSDFDCQPYVLKAPANESPIDVPRIVEFIDSHRFRPEEIRQTVEHLTWKRQMEIVIEQLTNR